MAGVKAGRVRLCRVAGNTVPLYLPAPLYLRSSWRSTNPIIIIIIIIIPNGK